MASSRSLRWVGGVSLTILAALVTPVHAFVTFETGQVRPLALSPNGSKLFALNTPDNRLEIFSVSGGTLTHLDSVPVGMEPIAVAARNDSEVWVVNHLSDSVSIVDVGSTPPRVVRTLLVGDEPRDIVFAGPTDINGDFIRAFITTARRGQNLPLSVPPNLTTPGTGRALIFVFDATDLGTSLTGDPETILQLFGDTPRALAATADGSTVYAAVFHSGNQTTAVTEGAVCNGGSGAAACNVGGGGGDGVHVPGGMTGNQVPGGLPAPNQNVEMTNGPETGLIVRFNGSIWADQLGRNWTNAVRFDLPDLDVFEIDADVAQPGVPTVVDSFAHVGTALFNMVVNPNNNKLYVSNTEARNEVRFEGPGTSASTVRGHLHEARITVIDGTTVLPRHLNKHITAVMPNGYRTVPMPAAVKDNSLATPLDMAVSSGGTLYVSAFGSSKVGTFSTTALENNTFTPSSADHINVTGGGPTGLALDETNNRLYVLTRFDNALKVVDIAPGPTHNTEIAQHPLHNPEPPVVTNGRHILYDARFTSSNGEASCSSCHLFSDFDSLGWDLGNPDDIVRSNPNPPGPVGGGQAFHPMKGPMTTQTLRGLANHGPMHWRGDRTGGYVGQALNEQLAFEEFNVAFAGLLGRDEGQIPDTDMTAFAQFILEVTLPPNPIRDLDNDLTGQPAANGRNFFLNVPGSDLVAECNGCHTLDPSQGFFGTGGLTTFENEPQEFKVAHLRNAYQKVGMFGMPDVQFIDISVADRQHQGNQIRGFGFLHDGSIDTVFHFLQATVFVGFGNNTQRREVEDFVMKFDTTFAPMVGQQVTLTNSNGAIVDARLDMMIQRAMTNFTLVGHPGAKECDLVVKGNVGGEPRGYLMNGTTGEFQPDRVADDTKTDTEVRALASGAELTYTCVPPGEGTRMALDRDEDGFFDSDERDAGSDPADPNSIPGGGPTPTPTNTPTPTTGPSLCGSAPPPGCRSPGKSSLIIKAGAGREKLTWKWLNGDATDLAAFGDPAGSSTAYSLCVYSGLGNVPIMEAGPLPQDVCAGGQCWQATGSGYRYKDTTSTNDGVRIVTLKAGGDLEAKTIVKGKGSNLPLPPFGPSGLTMPINVALVNSSGECWAASYTNATENSASGFKAKF